MSNRFYVGSSPFARSARPFLVAAALLGVAVLSAVPSSAHAARSASIPAELLQVDAPTPHAVLTNGASVAISGWTAGRRVDVYLDGPSGIGTGIGSVEVREARPDVAARMGAELAYSGFEIPFTPLTLASGEHMLFVYSLIDGAWALQTVPVIGAGNVLPTDRAADGDDSVMDNGASPDTGTDAPGDSGTDTL